MLGTSWKTSLMGWLLIGGDVIAFISKTLEAQSLPSTLFEWVAFGMAMITGIGMILAKDRDVSGLPKVVPMVLLAIMAMGVTACSTYMPTSDGRYQRVKSTQEPVAFGVSNSYAMLESCKGTQVEGYTYEKLNFTECFDLPNTRQHASAPGFFPQILTGLLNLAGFGWVATAQGESSATANAVSSSTGGGGRH